LTGRIIKITAAQWHRTKNGLRLLDAAGMAFFARSADLVAQALVGLMEQVFQQGPSIFE